MFHLLTSFTETEENLRAVSQHAASSLRPEAPGEGGQGLGGRVQEQEPLSGAACGVRSDRPLQARCRDLGRLNRSCWCSGVPVNFSFCGIKPVLVGSDHRIIAGVVFTETT